MNGGSGNNGRGLHGQLVEELGRAIAAGELDALEPLVPEAIGARHSVSRSVVREALRVLQSKGMVVSRQNVGTFVRPVMEWHLLDPDVIAWRMAGESERDNMRDLFELRVAVEPYAAALAASRADAATREALLVAVGDMEAAAAAKDFARFTDADVQFHGTLFGATGNPLIEQLTLTVIAALRVRRQSLMRAGSISGDALTAHRTVAEAVAARDADAAREGMHTLLDVGTRDVETALARPRRGAATSPRR